MITSDARTTCGLFGKIEQRIIDLFCAREVHLLLNCAKPF